MSRGYYIAYRVFGAILNILACLTLVFSVSLTFEVGPQPILMAILFVSACMLIYTTLSRLFFVTVMKNRQPLRRNLKDWIIANAVVSILGLSYVTANPLTLLINRSEMLGLVAALNNQLDSAAPGQATPLTVHMMIGLCIFMIAVLATGLIHCIWTLVLVRRNKAYFQEA